MSFTSKFSRVLPRAAFSAAAMSLLIVAGCGGGGGDTVVPSPSPSPSVGVGRVVPQPGWSVNSQKAVQTQRKWTILVYMNGANDLEQYGSLNVNQMEQFGGDPNVNVVVQFKRISNQYDNSDGDWAGTRRYEVTKDTNNSAIKSTLLSQRDDADMGRPSTLQEFVRWGLATYPADKVALVLWNHGAGWRTQKLTKTSVTRGVSYDDVTDHHIDTIQIPAAMNIDRKWDLLIFDASLMQMAEVAYELRDQAGYIVGSEESPPGEGYKYDLWLGPLTKTPTMSGVDLGKLIAQSTFDGYGADSEITQSVIDTSRVPAVATAINSLGDALLKAKGQWGEQIAFARDNAENYAYSENKDILDFVRLLTENPSGSQTPRVNDAGVLAACAQVKLALGSAIVKNVNGSQHPRSNGQSILLCSPNLYRRLDIEQADGFGQRYGELAMTKAAPRWQAFLTEGPP